MKTNQITGELMNVASTLLSCFGRSY